MRRITISVEGALADAFDGLVERKGYLNRSEAFRDLLRRALIAKRIKNGSTYASVLCPWSSREANIPGNA